MKALFKTNCPSIIVDAARCTLHINYNMPFHCRLDSLCIHSHYFYLVVVVIKMRL